MVVKLLVVGLVAGKGPLREAEQPRVHVDRRAVEAEGHHVLQEDHPFEVLPPRIALVLLLVFAVEDLELFESVDRLVDGLELRGEDLCVGQVIDE